MEPVQTPPRATSSEPSLPSRTSVGKADSSPSRKRARLDSGSRAIRGTSEELLSPSLRHNELHSTSTAPPILSHQDTPLTTSPQQPSRVTINVRTQPMTASSEDASTIPPEPTSGSSQNATSPPHNHSDIIETSRTSGTDPIEVDTSLPSPQESPVVELEIMEPDDMDEDTEPAVIELDGDDNEDTTPYMEQFPYLERMGSLSNTVNAIVDHFQDENHFDHTILNALSSWLELMPNQQWRNIISDNRLFWDEIATITFKIISRRTIPKSETFSTVPIQNYLTNYMTIFSQLLQIDIEFLRQFPATYPFQKKQWLYGAKHLKVLTSLFRGDDNPLLFALAEYPYPVDVLAMCTSIACRFVQAPSNGVHHLSQFVTESHGRVPPHITTNGLRVLRSVVRYATDHPAQLNSAELGSCTRDLIKTFRAMDKALQEVGKVLPVELNRDLVIYGSDLIHDIIKGLCINNNLEDANALATEILEESGVSYERQYLPALTASAYKFKLFQKYIAKAKMELRVLCINEMDAGLVALYKQYEPDIKHQVLQYVASFLLDQKVIDYIVGVDSHPQLISRSGNVVGFLLVTHRYTNEETDKIWQTVTSSQDPRVVSATLQMLKGILHLMKPKEALYILNSKIRLLPIEEISTEMIAYFRDLCAKLGANHQQGQLDWGSIDPAENPYHLCFRLVRETSPSMRPSARKQSISKEAADQLRIFSRTLPIEERTKTLSMCVQRLKGGDPEAAADIHAIHAVACLQLPEDAKVLTEDLELARHLVPELCSFVDQERLKQPSQTQVSGLSSRLDLLSYIIVHNPSSIPEDLIEPLWEHLFGINAINNTLCDLAWRKMCDLAKTHPNNEFLKVLLDSHVSNLPPVFFTIGFYNFVVQMSEYLFHRGSLQWDSEGTIQVPGASLLWRIILTAPHGTIEEIASKTLAQRYLDIARVPGATFQSVEAAHIALAKQCIDQLLPSFLAIRSESESDAGDSSSILDQMRFTRTALFMGLFVQAIRVKPEFYPDPKALSMALPIPQTLLKGKPMEIRYQAFDGQETDIRTIQVGEDDTVEELKERLTQLTGFSSFRVIARGNDLNLDSLAKNPIKDIQGINWLLVKKQPNTPQARSEKVYSKFEEQILEHFQEIYNCMDSDDRISDTTFAFLALFPPTEAATEAVDNDGVTAAVLFPDSKPFMARYSCRALAARLSGQLKQGVAEKTFISRSIKLLTEALLNENLIDSSMKRHDSILMATLFVDTLLAFLKERPFEETPVEYFGDEEQFVTRLFGLIQVAANLSTETKLLCQCYSVLLEASLHSRKIWDSLIKREDLAELHRTLLLQDPRPGVHSGAAQSIEALCGNPSGYQPVDSGDILQIFWRLLSGIIPDSALYPRQCGQLFTIAEFVFRSYDEHHRDEKELRLLFSSWSELLLNYEHQEIVGKDEPDQIIIGYTKLLSACAQSLKSFKRPLNGHELIERLFERFLFVTSVSEIGDDAPLPVLEGSTRRGLYDLILALCEDRDASKRLYNSMSFIYDDEQTLVQRGFGFDREEEIRSSTGYVGLHNPRNICYMNSLLTQLFMNREFRRFLLGMDVAEANASQKLLAETQKLFAIMQNGYVKAADPRDFAACVRGLDNAPIDITIQMDADEFYNLLFDQWEQQMLSESAKQRFRSFYGGKSVTQVKSKQCEHISEREESYFVIQCDVKGKQNLHESLQSYVQGDVMEGDNKYKCESCGGKFVDAVKRTCLKDVPDNLILHLKRFDFDLTNMTRCKIDDFFEFPDKIDMSHYKADHLSNPGSSTSPDMFELVGVLIHQGTAEGGHYYSFIRERPSRSTGTAAWFDFNDKDVSDLEMNLIKTMGYGGWSDEAYSQYNQAPRQKAYNAYMLFYQRTSTMVSEQSALAVSTRRGPLPVPVPAPLEQQIADDNDRLIRAHGLFDPHHSSFIRALFYHQRSTLSKGVCSEDHELEKAAMFVTVLHLRQVVVRSRDLPELDSLERLIREAIHGCTSCCRVFLDSLRHEHTLSELLFRSPYPRVRSKTRSLLLEGLDILRKNEPALYGLEVTDSELQTINTSALPTVLARCEELIRCQLALSGRGWEDFFQFLCELCQGPDRFPEVALLLKDGFLQMALEILSVTANKRLQARYEGMATLLEKKRGVYNKLVEFVWTLLSFIDLKQPPVPDRERTMTSFDPATMRFALTKHESNLLLDWNTDENVLTVLGKALELWDASKDHRNHFIPATILGLLLDAFPGFGKLQALHQSITCGISELAAPHSEPYVRAAIWYCGRCPDESSVGDLIHQMSKIVNTHQSNVGYTHLTFFSDVLDLQNDRIYDMTGPDYFYAKVIDKVSLWGVGFLTHENEYVRRRAGAFIESLFAENWTKRSKDTNILRYKKLRDFIRVLLRRLKLEASRGASRGFMTQFQTCLTDSMDALQTLAESADPDSEDYKDPGDLDFILGIHTELDQVMALWPVEDELLASGNETYEHSEYASDSEFADEIP